jgi:hypothetical protein
LESADAPDPRKSLFVYYLSKSRGAAKLRINADPFSFVLSLAQSLNLAIDIRSAFSKSTVTVGSDLPECSDHGEALSGMYTSAMIDEEGNPILRRETITFEQAELLRKQGRAGGLATASEVG